MTMRSGLRFLSMATLAISLVGAVRAGGDVKGTWRVISIGPKTLPEKMVTKWKIDEKGVQITLAGNVMSRSGYRVGKDGDHDAIWLWPEGKATPDRAGTYEVKGEQLRIQVELADKPPADWDEKKLMVMQREK